MTIKTIDEALTYLSRDPKSVEAECAAVLRKVAERLERVQYLATCWQEDAALLCLDTERAEGKRAALIDCVYAVWDATKESE